MSPERLFTERVVVQREREAFRRGCQVEFDRYHRELGKSAESPDAHGDDYGAREQRRREAADRTYKMPKVERPRVKADPHVGTARWRVASGKMEVRSLAWGGWKSPDESWGLTAERVAVWHDLYTTPTEWVEETEP